MESSVVIPINEASQVSGARRIVSRLADKIGFTETEVGTASLVVTEAANNLIKHAGHGHLVTRSLGKKADRGMEVVALDKGRGMNDVSQCMRDGYSTAGSPGTGLGAIARLSNAFDIYSNPGSGTAVMSQFGPVAPAHTNARLEIGAICVPTSGEEVCGDSWSISEQPERSLILLVDGLGHGEFAAQAAREAVRVFEENLQRSPAQIIQAAHGPLRSTRGAAMAVAEINYKEGVLRYAGLGNIAGTVASGGATRSLVSHNGTAGHELHRLQEFTYPWPAGALLIMHSDGLQTRWSFANYPGLASRHPATIAGVLYRDFQRGRDDVTVVVARERKT